MLNIINYILSIIIAFLLGLLIKDFIGKIKHKENTLTLRDVQGITLANMITPAICEEVDNIHNAILDCAFNGKICCLYSKIDKDVYTITKSVAIMKLLGYTITELETGYLISWECRDGSL